MHALQDVASILGRPVDRLQELDRRPLPLAFIEGRYETVVVRDRVTGELFEVTLDLDRGRRADPDDLRRLDRERAAVEGQKLEPGFLDLVLSHPELRRVEVRLRFSLEAVQTPDKEADWSDVALRRAFQSRLDQELRALEIGVPMAVVADAPELEATLSVTQIVRLAGSPLIQVMELVSEPRVPDH